MQASRITPPLRGSRRDGAVSTQQTGNIVYITPRNRAGSLMQASSITPPLRGSRSKGAARSRSGGGPTRRRDSEIQRWAGGAGVGPPPQKPSPSGSTSATPPQGGSDRRAKPHPGTRASRPQPYSLDGGCGATARRCRQAVRPCRREPQWQGPKRPTARYRSIRVAETAEAVPGKWCGRDARVPGWASSTQQTGNMVYITPRNRAGSLMQAARITPPLRGSRRDGAVCRRSGGGPTRRRESEIQRWVGGAGVGPPPQKPSPSGSTSATPPQGGSDT